MTLKDRYPGTNGTRTAATTKNAASVGHAVSSPAELVSAVAEHVEPTAASIEGIPAADTYTPADRYAELFAAVQTSRVFADSKTFVDCTPRIDPSLILQRYRKLCHTAEFELKAFVDEHFDPPPTHGHRYTSDPQQNIVEHIDGLWDVLTRLPEEHPPFSSLLPLPKPYVVPGGRFGELYYWDSYFTMLGLAASGRSDLLRSMMHNFAYLIDTYGHIPNGTRTYYLSRSQPPVFALMVELLETEDLQHAQHYLPQLRREYRYWMSEAPSLAPGQAFRHVVKLHNGEILNRYWDDRDTPRDESYLEDIETARGESRPANEIYRDLRAGAASGWDFSSRWLEHPSQLSSIRTTSILPVDLNALLYKLEATIADLSTKVGDEATAAEFLGLSRRRRVAMDNLLWHEDSGSYRDYDWRQQRQRDLSAATVAPLFVGLASNRQAAAVARTITAHLLTASGVATTLIRTDQQWDHSNVWAPLQWMAILGLSRYGEVDLAETVACRWLDTVGGVYKRDGKLVEKYHAASNAAYGSGGEYPLQDGFGWTNGITRKLLSLYVGHTTNAASAAIKS